MKTVVRFFWSIFNLSAIGLAFYLIYRATNTKKLSSYLWTNIITLFIYAVNFGIQFLLKNTTKYSYYSDQNEMDYNIVWKTVTAQFLNTTMVLFSIKIFPIIRELNIPKDQREEELDGSNLWGPSGLLNLTYTLMFNQIIVTVGM